MNISAKVIGVILLVVALAGGLIFSQYRSSSPRPLNLNTHDMQVIFQEMLPPRAQKSIAENADEKKKFLDQIKQLLAVAQLAESEGYADRPEVRSQIALQRDQALNNVYQKKNPNAKATEEEVTQYLSAHPKDFDDFLQNNPGFAQQAQGPQREALKHKYGEFKVMAERAHKGNLEQDDMTRLLILIGRSQVLHDAYIGDIQKSEGQQVSDTEIEAYYKEHSSDFEEVRVRHILISTQPQSAQAADDDDKDKKDSAKAKTLTKDEARAKAQGLLDRIRKGEDFAKLAQEYSDDPGSKSRGGEYDFFGKGRMVPEFENAAFSMKPGEVSDPVETQYGFHIIKLEERRPSQPPSVDAKLKQQITEKVKEAKLNERLRQIAESSTVVIAEDFDTSPKAGPSASGAGPATERD